MNHPSVSPASVAPRPARLLLLCQHFFPEMISTGQLLTELGVALRRRGWSIDVIAAQPMLGIEARNERVPPFMTHEGINIFRVPSMGSHRGRLMGRALFSVTYPLRALMKVVNWRHRYDGILVLTNPPTLGVAAAIARGLLRVPYVLLVHDVYPDVAVRLGVLRESSVVARLWDALSRWVLRRAAGVIVLGRDMEDTVRDKMPKDDKRHLYVIPHWAAFGTAVPIAKCDNAFRRRTNPANRFLVQYSGRHGRTHNLEPLIEAARILQDEAVLFQFIGDGAKKSALRERADDLRNVQFLPYQPYDDLQTVLSAADLGVVCLESGFKGLSVPSKTYGIMAAGVAVLALVDRASEIGLVVDENECGLVVPGATADGLAHSIMDLIRDPARCLRMGQSGRSAFERQYTLVQAATQYDAALRTSFGLAKRECGGDSPA